MGEINFPRHYKTFYILYNNVYLGIGVVMLAIGISSLLEILSFGSLVNTAFIAGSVIFISIGALKILTSLLGYLGLLLRKKPLFAIYVILSVVLMLLTFVGAIYGFLARPSAFSNIQGNLVSAYNNSNTTAIAEDIINLQDSLNCCGPDRAFLSTVNNCTSTRPLDTVFGQGCLQFLSDAVLDNLYNIGAVGMAFGSFELTTFLVAIQHTEGSGL